MRHVVLVTTMTLALATTARALEHARPAENGDMLALPHQQQNAAEIGLALRNLSAVGSVLYVAAHPDDENTRLLAWLAARGLRAGYLSITRGDGGQNLIGTEQDEMLGLVRTHELLAARRIDGAEQLFTRARDFGYSKSAEETLRLWGEQEILGDVVLAIRRFRPDVLVTRFTTQPPNHGHHTASAILAAQAFTAAADPKRFPEQLTAGLTTWQADRLLHNVSTWNLKPDADLSAHMRLDVGAYEPLLGRSIGEIAASSRSQHKSQGFGVAAERGPLLEYFTPLLSAKAPSQMKADPFAGLVLDWRRIPRSETIVAAINRAIAGFDATAPHKTLPALLALHDALERGHTDGEARWWLHRKRLEVERLMVACSGLFLQARAATPSVVPGDAIAVELSALLRAPASVKLDTVALLAQSTAGAPLAESVAWKAKVDVRIDGDAQVSTPYWLRRRMDGGRFAVDEARLIGRPDDDPAMRARFRLTFGVKGRATTVDVDVPVVHVWTDPVRGELSRLVEIAPAVSASFTGDVLVMPNGSPQEVAVVLTAGRDKATGTLRLAMPEGYGVEPVSALFDLAARGDQHTVTFRVVPAKGRAAVSAQVRLLIDEKPGWRARMIAHDHLPPLTVRTPASLTLVPVALAITGRRIGYIPGPGDKVAEALAAVGYQVTSLPEARLASATNAELATFDAIVVGIRAFNAAPGLSQQREKLLRYVEGGGRLVVQYQTNSRVGPLAAGVWPAPLEIGRDRVTDEGAKLTPLDVTDAVWTTPNRLGPTDFEGWVQERGLYLASKWDPLYTPLLSMNDVGEAPLLGGLLVAKHGKGKFIYTGLSFFRQLPAGVPGAYRLFANVIAR